MIETIKAIIQQILAFVNVPSALIASAVIVSSAITSYSLTKKYRKHRLKKKMRKAEANIRKYLRDNNPTKLRKNLITQQKLRLKGAKRRVIIKTEFGLNARTYNDDKLSKLDKKRIKYDAKVNINRLKDKFKKAEKIRRKHPEFQEEIKLDSFVESVNYKDANYDLPTNMLAVNSKSMLQKYEYDVKNKKINNLPDRQAGKGIYPMTLEISNKEDQPIFKLSDVSTFRFWDYSREGLGYLHSKIKQNKEDNIQETYTIEYFDTLKNPKKQAPMIATVSNEYELMTFVENYASHFKGENNEYFDSESVEDLSRAVVQKSLEYDFKRKEASKKVNELEYANGVSESLKSKELERIFKNHIRKYNLTGRDAHPSMTTVKMDGKEVFKVTVESERLMNETDRYIDAYIFVLQVFREYKGIYNSGKITKFIEGITPETYEINKVPVTKEGYKSVEIDDMTPSSIYQKNATYPDFMPTLVAIAKEFKFGLSSSFLRGKIPNLLEKDARLIDVNLAPYQIDPYSFNLEEFGVIDPNKQAKTQHEYPDFSNGQKASQSFDDGNQEAKKKSAQEQYEARNAVDKPQRKQANHDNQIEESYIKTGNEKVEKEFYKAVENLNNSRNYSNFYKADLNYSDAEEGVSRITIKLALKAFDRGLFSEYLLKLMNEVYDIAKKQYEVVNKQSYEINDKKDHDKNRFSCHLRVVLVTGDKERVVSGHLRDLYSIREIKSDAEMLMQDIENDNLKKQMSNENNDLEKGI